MKLDHLVATLPSIRLTTDRLLIRAMQEGDVPTAIEHEKDHRIMQWIRDPLPADEVESKVRQLFEPWQGEEGKWHILVVADRASDAMLGIVCCRVTISDNDTLEFGYRLHPDVFRRG